MCSIITPTHIICANVGDSRCVVGTTEATISMTDDHKPNNEEEKQRIEKAGGFVMWDRVNGELAMSRALGDFRYKTDERLTDKEYLVICYPDVSTYVRTRAADQLMVLACDGVWDVMSNAESISFLTEIIFSPENQDKSDEEGNGKDKVNKTNGSKVENKNSSRSISSTSSNNDSSSKGNGTKAVKASKDRDGGESNKDNAVSSTASISSQEAAEALTDLAFNEGSTDNISAVVVRFC